MSRERREGVLSSIQTMNEVYDRMMQSKDMGQSEQQMPQEMPQLPQ
jgi:hypothetical protein